MHNWDAQPPQADIRQPPGPLHRRLANGIWSLYARTMATVFFRRAHFLFSRAASAIARRAAPSSSPQIIQEEAIEQLREAGAEIRDIEGLLVLPGQQGMERALLLRFAGNGHDGTANLRRPLAKTEALLARLATLGIQGEDLTVHRGSTPPNLIRSISYLLIDIPKIPGQIAICDQAGQITFVSRTIHLPEFWMHAQKETLASHPDIIRVRYDRHGGWLDVVEQALLQDGFIEARKRPHDPFPGVETSCRVRGPGRTADRCPLSQEKIREWMVLFREKEGRYPSANDKVVWEKDADGVWTKVQGESWHPIDAALRNGNRGLAGKESLAKLKEALGLSNNLSEETLKIWIADFHEKEGRFPTTRDRTVWQKDAEDGWSPVPGEDWPAIDAVLRKGFRGLPKGSSLAIFKRTHGFVAESAQRPQGAGTVAPAIPLLAK